MPVRVRITAPRPAESGATGQMFDESVATTATTDRGPWPVWGAAYLIHVRIETASRSNDPQWPPALPQTAGPAHSALGRWSHGSSKPINLHKVSYFSCRCALAHESLPLRSL